MDLCNTGPFFEIGPKEGGFVSDRASGRGYRSESILERMEPVGRMKSGGFSLDNLDPSVLEHGFHAGAKSSDLCTPTDCLG